MKQYKKISAAVVLTLALALVIDFITIFALIFGVAEAMADFDGVPVEPTLFTKTVAVFAEVLQYPIVKFISDSSADVGAVGGHLLFYLNSLVWAALIVGISYGVIKLLKEDRP